MIAARCFAPASSALTGGLPGFCKTPRDGIPNRLAVVEVLLHDVHQARGVARNECIDEYAILSVMIAVGFERTVSEQIDRKSVV